MSASPILFNTEHCKDGKLDNSNAVSSQSPNSQEETNQPAPDNTEEELTEPIQDIQVSACRIALAVPLINTRHTSECLYNSPGCTINLYKT